MEHSAGIIPFHVSEDEPIRYFVGHPGGISWAKKDFWMFLKGHIEKGETDLECAIREFYEESGISLSPESDFISLGTVKQNKHKLVTAFALNVPKMWDVNRQCLSMVDDETPEIDKYDWKTWDELCVCTHPKHTLFYEKIEKEWG